MKRNLCVLLCITLTVMLTGCSNFVADLPAEDAAVTTTTTVVPVLEDVPIVKLIQNDDSSLNKEFVQQWLERYRDDKREIRLSAYLDQVAIQCLVTDDMIALLEMDEWEEVSLAVDDEEYKAQAVYTTPVDHDPEVHKDADPKYMYVDHYASEHGDGYYVLGIGDEYAALVLKVMVPYSCDNGVLGEASQTQGMRVWKLPQDEPGEILRAIEAYGEMVPTL